MIGNCIDCGAHFERATEESWRIRCRKCYFNFKAGRQEFREALPPPDDLRREFLEHVKGLLQMCHPDLNDGSDLSHKLTVWLLTTRQRLGGKHE